MSRHLNGGSDIITEHVRLIVHVTSDFKEGLAFAIEWGRGIDEGLTKNLSRCLNNRTDYEHKVSIPQRRPTN